MTMNHTTDNCTETWWLLFDVAGWVNTMRPPIDVGMSIQKRWQMIFWCDHRGIMIDCIATYTAASSSSWIWWLIAYAKANHEFLKILHILEDDECWCYRTCLFIDVLWQRHRPQFPTSGPLSRFGAANFHRQHIDVLNIQKIMSNLVRFLWSMGISGS